MKKFLKEYWFVLIVAAFFVGVGTVFAVNQASKILPSKTVGGKQVVASAADENIFADDIYDKMYSSYGQSELLLLFQEAVCDYCVKDTEEINSLISYNVDYTISYCESYYGVDEDYLNSYYKYYFGYPNYETYVRYSLKTEYMLMDYIKEHKETYITDEFWDEITPKVVSYCLIKFDDPENPTEEEQAAYAEAVTAWESWDGTFAEFAKQYSDDTSTSDDGGKFGYLDANTGTSGTGGIDSAFKAASLALSAGETTEWVFSESFGYFLIHCDSASYEDMEKESGLLSSVITKYDTLANDVMWEKAQEAGIKFADEEVENYIKEYLGVATDEESEAE